MQLTSTEGTMPTNFYASKLCSVKMANSAVHVKTPILCMAIYCLPVCTSSFTSFSCCSLIASTSIAALQLHPLQLPFLDSIHLWSHTRSTVQSVVSTKVKGH